MSDLHEIGLLADLPDRKPVIVRVQGREIAIVRIGNDVFAARNVCPHQTQSFHRGLVHDRVVAGKRVGDVEVVSGDPLLGCPWHGYEYSLRTGECAVDPKLRVRVYRCEVEAGCVRLDLSPRSAKVQGGE
jgi:nitrite reductase/ring-hydroxylating ferredoxin subunit